MVLAGPAFTSKSAVSEAAGRVAVSSHQHGRPDSSDMLAALYEGCILVEDVGNDPISGGLGENFGLSVLRKHGSWRIGRGSSSWRPA